MLKRRLCVYIVPVLATLAGCAAEIPKELASPINGTAKAATSNVVTGSIDPVETVTSIKGTRVVAGELSRVFLIAGFDGDCKPLAATAITIERHPSKGIVTLQPVLETAIQYSLSGKCVGSKVPGTGVYYTARADAVGPDTFTIAARNGKGAMATQNITVNIAE